MSATDAVKGLEQHLMAFVESAKQEIEKDLPVVARVATDAESNPVVLALAAAVHLPAAPEVLAALASVVGVLDAALGNAKAQGAAELQAQQAAAPDTAPPAA